MYLQKSKFYSKRQCSSVFKQLRAQKILFPYFDSFEITNIFSCDPKFKILDERVVFSRLEANKGNCAGFKSVSCGDYFSAALTEDGCIYRWGTFRGRIYRVPTLLLALLPYQIAMVSCGPSVISSLVAGSSLYLKIFIEDKVINAEEIRKNIKHSLFATQKIGFLHDMPILTEFNDEEKIFLKTIYPSRELHKTYNHGGHYAK